ncbi:unnamed protein product [Prorocentrum cordatum]|uniref:Uncharacterized protein n=1 Tax=Prorocentrum cordatum TaxID=2364126 RepID=A0ABN9WP09_9DINO|nr:unnamed protein product [Polarella glacialis]
MYKNQYPAALRPRSVVDLGFHVLPLYACFARAFCSFSLGQQLCEGLDIQTAFDSMARGAMTSACQSRGMHPALAEASLREVYGMMCILTLPGADPSDISDLGRGSKPSGIDAPGEFNIVLGAAMDKLLARCEL